MAYVLFEHFLSFLCFDFLLRSSNCKQWLLYQQRWENQKFRSDGLEDLDTISLIDMYERLIHAVIQLDSPPYLYYQIHNQLQT